METHSFNMKFARIIADLEVLPEQFKQAAQDYVNAVANLEGAKFVLRDLENELMVAGKINGKNKDIRDAEFWEHTKNVEDLVRKSKATVDTLEVEMDYLKNRLESTKLIAQLLLESKH